MSGWRRNGKPSRSASRTVGSPEKRNAARSLASTATVLQFAASLRSTSQALRTCGGGVTDRQTVADTSLRCVFSDAVGLPPTARFARRLPAADTESPNEYRASRVAAAVPWTELRRRRASVPGMRAQFATTGQSIHPANLLDGKTSRAAGREGNPSDGTKNVAKRIPSGGLLVCHPNGSRTPSAAS